MFNQLHYLISDLKRWPWKSLNEIFYNIFEFGIWAVIFYRLGRFLYLINIPIIKIFFRLLSFFIYKFTELFLGVVLRPGTDIGPGLYIGHTGNIRISSDVKAGKNLSIGTGVFIAMKGLGTKGVPVLGDNIYIGVGAKILGPIKIGNNVRVGANAVVVKDVPDNATVVGVPARIIERN